MAILIVGCGRMGSAMAQAWAKTERVLAYDPNAHLPMGVDRVEALETLPDLQNLVVVLAVKPLSFWDVAHLLRSACSAPPLALSIMAGISLDRLSAGLGGHRHIVRAMPNTPAAIGKGMTVAVADRDVGLQDQARIDRLLAVTGDHLWVEKEQALDAVTALSGSGPAYFFRAAEALAAAGMRQGLPADVAMKLARATLAGAGALADATDLALGSLREQVTSPGGTTAAGLDILNQDLAIDSLMERVVAAATARSRELGC